MLKEDYKLVALEDFSIRTDTDYQARVIGRNGIDKSNSNGHILLKTCASHDPLITNTAFRLTNHKTMSGCINAAKLGF